MQPFTTKINRKKARIDPNISLHLDMTDLAGGRLSQADNIWVSQGPVKYCRGDHAREIRDFGVREKKGAVLEDLEGRNTRDEHE